MFNKKPDPEPELNRGLRKTDRELPEIDGGLHRRLARRGSIYLNQVKTEKDPDWHRPI